MKTLFTVVLSGIISLGIAQTKISGKIMDAQGESIPGANISLEQTYDGASSDVEGKFQFTTTETGNKILVVTFVGHKGFKQNVELNGKPIFIEVKLEEEISQLEAVEITAGSFTASDASRRTVFKAIDIATTAGATADIAGALNTLPGTQKNGESGRLFVRGGDGNETRTFIDGNVVLDAYNPSAPNTPSRGRFLPFMFKGTSFSTGGYSAEYGQALSSALVLNSKDDGGGSRTDIGLLSVGGDVAHTQSWDRGSASAKVQYTNLQPYMGLISQRVDWKSAPVSIEASGALRQHVGKDGMFKVYGNFNNSNFALYEHSISDYNQKFLYDLKNNYRYLNSIYQSSLSEKWSMRSGLSYTYLQNDALVDQTNIVETQQGIHAKTVFDGSITDKFEIKSGAEIIQRNYSQDFNLNDGTSHSLAFSELIAASFVEADLYTSNNFVMRGGARMEYNNLINQFSVDPRASLAYKMGKKGQFSFAYGKFRQTAKNELVRVNHQLNPEKAEHFILSYQLVNNKRTFRAETYYKKYSSLVKYVQGDANVLDNSGDGFAKGFELFWRDNGTINNIDYWISYSYLDTKRNYLNYPYEAIPTFASKHNLSVVAKYFIQPIRSQLGVTYSITSGRPYNDPNSDKFNGGKTPTYSDLSFNWSYLPKPYLIIYFSCTNVLGRNNIFGYNYSTTPDTNGIYASRAITQAAPRFIFLGIFITLSKDKSMNQLPNL
ncbi:MAG: TonB-dependent receptor [Chryseolinea sp.]